MSTPPRRIWLVELRQAWRRLVRRVYTRFGSVLSMVLRLSLLAGALLELASGNWQIAGATFGVAVVTFLPAILGRGFHVHIPPEFELLAVLFVYAALFLGEVQGYYQRFWWWDMALHSASGLLMGILGFLLVHVLNELEDLELHMKPAFVALFAFMFALGMGALWEIFEFAMDQLFGMRMQRDSLADTMTDLIVDGIGALVIAVAGYSYLRNPDSSSFLERWVDKFIEGNRRLFKAHRQRTGNG